MSVQFGRCNFGGVPRSPGHLENVAKVLLPYGPDGTSRYSQGAVDIFYYAFHTTEESRHKTQPYALKSGTILTWDGRLDNRADFIGLLRDCVSPSSADVAVVAAAYERWGTHCFARLIGDWALSVWDPNAFSLVLAKDHIGTRQLYYSAETDRLTWSTVVDPLVLFARKKFSLEEEYIAGWLGVFPATHLTPYVGIHSVPPGCFVRLSQGKTTVTRYWDFDPHKSIRYRSDADYEEHFRSVFAEAVRRRLRSDSPVLAELSGGMDSSSIVCVADSLGRYEAGNTPRLDTVSYYDDSEPAWNERAYFNKVEEKRGRTGCHIDVSSPDRFRALPSDQTFTATPAGVTRVSESAKQFAALARSQGNRVVLSGIGGDEVTGGVPTPMPELANLLARFRLGALAQHLKVWALDKRKPWHYLFFETVRGFVPPTLVRFPNHMQPDPWLSTGFISRNHAALSGYASRLKLFGTLPSFQKDMASLNLLRRQIACEVLPSNPPYEKRYPYLDRDFLEFIYAIPREQLVRPGQRRSLMRRALVGLVPDEILNRKRKAFVTRSPTKEIPATWESLQRQSPAMILGALGIVDEKKLGAAIEKLERGEQVPLVHLTQVVWTEVWLRNMTRWKLLPLRGHSRTPSARTCQGASLFHRADGLLS
jgi:asparagine synthase (glutamine-hydrolysing)